MNIAEFLIFAIEILGTVAFSLSGTLVGIERGLDFFGVIVLGTLTAVGGGILRDVLLGATPPAAFNNSIYVLVACIASAVTILLARKQVAHFSKKEKISKYMAGIGVFDAMGLGIFTVVGMNSAISKGFGYNAFLVIFIGVMTGVGGGLIRDICVHRTPIIFKKDIYATASLVGGFVYYYGRLHLTQIPAMLLGAGTIMAIRFVSMYYDLNLPKFERKL